MSQSKNVQDLKKKVNLLVKQSRWIDSERILSKILAMDPSNDSVLRKIGQVNEKLNNMNDAKYYYEKAMNINPKNIYTLKKLALLYHHQFDYISKAEKYYIKCIDINPNDDEIHFNLAILYTKQKQYSKASQSFLKCDYTKAAVNYHFGVYLLAVNKDETALQHFRWAKNIKPHIANYHFEYAKLCTRLGHIKKADESFVQALKLCHHQEAKMLFEYGLFCKYKHEDNTRAIFYIDSALLKPKSIIYKYMQLKCQQENINEISARKKYVYKRYDGVLSKDRKFSIKNVIQKRAELLLSGYINTNYISRLNSVYNYMPSDILLVMFRFFVGNYPDLEKDRSSSNVLRGFTEFGKNEIIAMLFDVLCPGRDETKIIFTITKLIDLIHFFWALRIHFILLLLPMSTITKFYDVLSMINETQHYINYKREIIQICCRREAGHIPLLLELFNQNDAFCEIFKSLLREETINIEAMVVLLSMAPIYWTVSNLKSLRLICMCSLFGVNVPADFDVDRSTIKILSEFVILHNGTSQYLRCIDPLLRLVGLEIELLNKHFNYELQNALDEILYVVWNNINSIFMTFHKKALVAVLKIFRNAGLNLKPHKMEWNQFFGAISVIASSSGNVEVCEMLQAYSTDIEVDDENYENWKHCVDLLLP